nr:MAG TPA: hypothetical protein [Caudoviricetes sp.]
MGRKARAEISPATKEERLICCPCACRRTCRYQQIHSP